MSTIADGQGLNITVQSYNGNLDFGVIVCRDLVPDVWHVTDLLQAAMAELLAATKPVSISKPASSRRKAS